MKMVPWLTRHSRHERDQATFWAFPPRGVLLTSCFHRDKIARAVWWAQVVLAKHHSSGSADGVVGGSISS